MKKIIALIPLFLMACTSENSLDKGLSGVYSSSSDSSISLEMKMEKVSGNSESALYDIELTRKSPLSSEELSELNSLKVDINAFKSFFFQGQKISSLKFQQNLNESDKNIKFDFCTMPYEQGDIKFSYCADLLLDTVNLSVNGKIKLHIIEEVKFWNLSEEREIFTEEFQLEASNSMKERMHNQRRSNRNLEFDVDTF